MPFSAVWWYTIYGRQSPPAQCFPRHCPLLIVNPLLGVVIGYYFNKVSTEARAESTESTAQSATMSAQQATEARNAAEAEAQAARSEAEEALCRLSAHWG